MAHYFCFSVEPLPSHPQYWTMQAGWAHVIVRDESIDSEQLARAYLARQHYKIQQLHTARVIPPGRESVMPPEARLALSRDPIYCEVSSYETGSGEENAGNPFA